jgi:2-C-methyl-D-erythritol 4-phosphate cytidylyltransferase
MTVAVLVAAGNSSRIRERDGGPKKEYRQCGLSDIDGKPLTVLGAALRPFFELPLIDSILICIPPDDEEAATKALHPRFQEAIGSRIVFCEGGPSRRASVHNALKRLRNTTTQTVLIHDGARPGLSEKLLAALLEARIEHQAVIPVLPASETPKEINGEGLIVRHPRRGDIVFAQTPQVFAFPAILQAHDAAENYEFQHKREFTDDAEVWAHSIGPVATIPGSLENKKITFPEDLHYVQNRLGN